MDGMLLQVIFYVFSGLAVFSALMVITQNNPVRCVLFLVLAFFASSVLWILVNAEFLALILVLVYVGAVMTFFLFVVMMLNIDVESMKSHFTRYLPLVLVVVALLVGLLLLALPKEQFNIDKMAVSTQLNSMKTDTKSENVASLTNTEALGVVLYTDYLFAFELAAVILLVAIIAAITLVHRNPIRSKRQDIVEQIMTRRDDRVTLVKMNSEKI